MVDRFVQQAISQVLTTIYEPSFHDHSYGFRSKRSAHDVLRQVQRDADKGYRYVVDMDLEKFFDKVNHSKLMELLSRTITDGRVISLIGKYLRAGVMVSDHFEPSELGVPQGGPTESIAEQYHAQGAGQGARTSRSQVYTLCR